tara:strand:+ start:433 stop:669 length:237 start_codon:yes stop_codon:yes gene_type:complete
MDLAKLTPKKFSLEIERIASNENLNHLDSVLHYCEKNNMEVETAKKLITRALKQKIEADASALKLIKTKESGVGKLPI